MPKIQFAVAMQNFFGDDVEEDDARGIAVEPHRQLRALLLTALAPAPLLEIFDGFVRPKRKVTLADVCIRGLNLGVEQNEKLDAKMHYARFELIRDIIAAEKAMTPLELESDDIALIKGAIVKCPFFTPWLIGQAIERLEGKGASDGEKGTGEGKAAPGGRGGKKKL